MEEFLVDVSGLDKSFGNLKVLSDINLTVRKGEMLALVGPDGAGKTTLVRTLCGLLPFSGSVRIFDQSIPDDIDRVKPYIGYLSQHFSLYGDLTVDENMEFFAEIHGLRNFKARREELLDFTRMLPFRKRLADQLSGGMKQKLSLACALIHTPRLIFLDEPTTGVDPVSRRDFWRILSRLLISGLTIVLTTPYMDEAERCGRVALLNQGRLLALDTPRKIKSLLGDRVFELVCSDIRSAVRILGDKLGSDRVQAFGDRLNVMVPEQGVGGPEISKFLSAGGVRCDSWQEVSPSLENVFIKLMN